MVYTIVVASGKGGTGKTFVSSNLLYYLMVSGDPGIGVDCDSEAPDLALALGGYREVLARKTLGGSIKAFIDHGRCIGCLECLRACRFYAIDVRDGKPFVDTVLCEGCRACSLVCNYGAIGFREYSVGSIVYGLTESGVYVVTTVLDPCGRGGGKLVYDARELATRKAVELGYRYIVVDAPAGIGCNVVSSITGSNLVVVVVEPTKPSIEGGRRIIEIARSFGTDVRVVLNKAGYTSMDQGMVSSMLGYRVEAVIPYDRVVYESIVSMKPVLSLYPDSRVSKIITSFYRELLEAVS